MNGFDFLVSFDDDFVELTEFDIFHSSRFLSLFRVLFLSTILELISPCHSEFLKSIVIIIYKLYILFNNIMINNQVRDTCTVSNVNDLESGPSFNAS